MKNTLFILIIFSFLACDNNAKQNYDISKANNPEFYHKNINELTKVIVYDIFSPPVASRIYSYATLAAYEALIPSDSSKKTMAGRIKDFKECPKPDTSKQYCYALASAKAFMVTARTFTFSVEKYDEHEQKMLQAFKEAGVTGALFDRSVAFGEAIGKHVVEYSKGDKYAQIRGLRYTIQNKPGTWVPTPPAYADAIEPYWGRIRTMALDSAAEFKAASVIKYDMMPSSDFHKEVTEVYEVSKTLSEDQKNIAWFWDDNAFVMNVQGHVMFADKKMTPGGHWLAITQTVAKQQKRTLMESAEAYMLVSMALRDAFINCWYEKYQSHKIRPETVINAKIDVKWVPFLQTPPFPEYTSGHSTISGASAEVLSQLFGENVTFTDSTEHKFGHGVRSFKSFREAAEQASISRVYGGIHFSSGCSEGLKVGYQVGKKVMTKKTK